ncbi:MAG: signal peptide peptidase SppA, partial [Promethearchaeota archaeon]
QTLNRLAKDKHNNGLILEIQTSLPFATTRTLINHLTDFKEQGKEVITFATTYSLPTYWLASSGSQVTVQNQGSFMINGLYSSRFFLTNLMKKYGFQFEKMAVSPYKSAGDEFVRADISPEAKKNWEDLYTSIFEHIIKEIAQFRRITESEVRKAIDKAPLTDQQALERKLIDQIVSLEQLPRILRKSDKKQKSRPFSEAHKATLIPASPSMRKIVAVIPLLGIIVDGKSREIPKELPVPFGDKQTGDHSIVPLIRAATASSRVAAGVLYVDSPGGSFTASESIRLAISEFMTRKPLVAYFSNIAASGSYYIAASAHYMVAQSQTITGSIGILSGKFNFEGFLQKYEINTAEFKIGKRADWMQPTKPLNEEERRVLTELLFYHYDHILGVVANGRNLEKEYLANKLAGGRVWTGAQALEHGLIDELGNFYTALNKARKLSRLKPNSGVIALHPPKRTTVPFFFRGPELIDYMKFLQYLSKTQIWAIEPNLMEINPLV